MATLWPWFAVAGLGALHGLNPATGWMFAAACGVRAHDRSHAVRAIVPIAVGHVVSIGLVATLVALGQAIDRRALVTIAAGLLIAIGLLHVARARAPRAPRRAATFRPGAGTGSLALISFITATLHGSGLMLVPALVPLCTTNTPARELTATGSLTLAVAAVAVHTAAMLIVTGLIAANLCRGVEFGTSWLRRRAV